MEKWKKFFKINSLRGIGGRESEIMGNRDVD